MADNFPADVQQFIAQHIETLAQLEILLLLRSEPQREWEPAEVARLLYTAEEMCASQLADLARRGFLSGTPAPNPRYRYQPSSEELSQSVDRLAALYAERRVAVITLIYSKPVNKVQTFADAFRLRKET
jgi:hypothetical protein